MPRKFRPGEVMRCYRCDERTADALSFAAREVGLSVEVLVGRVLAELVSARWHEDVGGVFRRLKEGGAVCREAA